MKKKKILNLTKIMLSIGFGLILSTVLTKEVFVAQSPQIRPGLGAYLIARLSPDTYFNRDDDSASDNLQELPFTPLAPGIYAKENESNYQKVVVINEVEWKQYEVIIKGEKVIVSVPANEPPPPQELLNTL